LIRVRKSEESVAILIVKLILSFTQLSRIEIPLDLLQVTVVFGREVEVSHCPERMPSPEVCPRRYHRRITTRGGRGGGSSCILPSQLSPDGAKYRPSTAPARRCSSRRRTRRRRWRRRRSLRRGG
jgi:hypothetical protein